MVVLRPSGQPVPAQPQAQVFDSWDAFTLSSVQPLGFYLEGWDAPAADDLILQLRRSPWWDRLAVVAPGEGKASVLADTAAPYADAVARAERSLAVRRSLRLALTDMRLEERVLYFLYVRDAMELAPQCTLTHPMLYHYPVVDALAQRGEDPGACLATLVRRKLLEPAQLVDRTRHCRTCGSAHIHYIDVCPHCSSLQIRKEASLHCFSCGHVAPESDFHHDGGLSCPQCSAALRHIGVDYDRPLTQYACGSCHHVFVETTTQARCLACRTSCAPSALDVREVASLRLRTRPHRAARRADPGVVCGARHRQLR